MKYYENENYGGNVANYLHDNTTLNKAFAHAKKIFQVDTHISAKILPNICLFDINYILSDFIPVECKQYCQTPTRETCT